jgi:hypothetical protein
MSLSIELFWREINQLYLLGRSCEKVGMKAMEVMQTNSLNIFFFLFAVWFFLFFDFVVIVFVFVFLNKGVAGP